MRRGAGAATVPRTGGAALLLAGLMAGAGCGGGDGGGTAARLDGLTALRLEPDQVALETTDQQGARAPFRAMGRFQDGSERDVSGQVAFRAEQPVGTFDGATFVAAAGAVGTTRVHADAPGSPLDATATVTVHLTARAQAAGLPSGAAALFPDGGTPDPRRAPTVLYPPAGVMLPPNLGSLEVHLVPGSPGDTLVEVAVTSAAADLRYYARCAPLGDGCLVTLDQGFFGELARANRGGPPAQLTVRATSDAGGGFGASAAVPVQVAQEEVLGGLYYWTTSAGTGIMRVDFGDPTQRPSLFLSPDRDGLPACVGCHALSRDGSKLVASLGGQHDGRLVFLPDLLAAGAAPTAGGLDGTTPLSTANHIQFAAFSPAGDRFAAVYGDGTDPAERDTLWIHDGATGQRIAAESLPLGFEPDHPDWSPDGSLLAVTHVGIHQTSQRPFHCGIDLIARNEVGWGPPAVLVPQADGRSRYNPSFSPDSSLLVYSESTCPAGTSTDPACDGDSDPSAMVWAIDARTGSAPVLLARANAGGPRDGAAVSNTFARFAPFQQPQGTGRLFWVTISSARLGGLRDPAGRRWLWMFAVDPDAVHAGRDGSYPALLLPFQDLGTSNHIGQWTQKVVAPG